MLTAAILHFGVFPKTPSLRQTVDVQFHRRPCVARVQDEEAGVSLSFDQEGMKELTPQSVSRELELISATDQNKEMKEEKELILNLSRRGEGWAEEIVPTVTVEWRPIKKKNKGTTFSKMQEPYSWKKGSLEELLSKAGVPNDQVEKVVAAAAAWRVTPKGRPLIDRRRRKRIEKNIRGVIEYLVSVCGVPEGADGVGSILVRAPQILLAKVGSVDRWYDRIVELAAFLHFHGHCNVPENYPVLPALGKWVRRIRATARDGGLDQERLQILYVLGFEFPRKVEYITKEWETDFDDFIEWVLWNREQGQPIDWTCLTWAKSGGARASKAAIWVMHQRELKRRKLLTRNVIRRLDCFQFKWDLNLDANLESSKWLNQFQELVFAVKEHRAKSAKNKGYCLLENISLPDNPSQFLDLHPRAFYQKKTSGSIQTTIFEQIEEFDFTRWNLDNLDPMLELELKPNIGLWLARQRQLWRSGKLSFDQVALFYSLGVDLNPYTVKQWRELAHATSRHIMNFDIEPQIAPKHTSFDNLDEKLLFGPSMLVLLEDIVSISDNGYIVERMEWKTFHALNAKEVTEGGAVITMEPTMQSSIHIDAHQDLQRVALSNNDESSEEEVGCSFSPSEMRRWVLTQRVLWKERRSTKAEIQYLAMLGLAWILYTEIVDILDEQWQQYFDEIQMKDDLNTLSVGLDDFLIYQRAMHRLGMLPAHRTSALESIGFSWNFQTKTESERLWDANISELINFRRQHGHCKVHASSALGEWIKHQNEKYESLSSIKTLQLRTLKASLS